MANPLLVGILLLVGRLMLGCPSLRDEGRRVLPAVLVLCLTEALIALAAPGADGLGGLCAMLHIEPVPGLEGALGPVFWLWPFHVRRFVKTICFCVWTV